MDQPAPAPAATAEAPSLADTARWVVILACAFFLIREPYQRRTAQLRYAMDSTSTNGDGLGLRSLLNMTISAGACPTSATVLYSNALWTDATTHAKFGSNVAGNQAGDRTLASGAFDDLCFAWSLPGATTTGQGATTTATFTFYAEQTANNP